MANENGTFQPARQWQIFDNYDVMRVGTADFDGDGKQDLWRWGGMSEGMLFHHLIVHLSTGSEVQGFKDAEDWAPWNKLSWGQYGRMMSAMGTADFNGDGKQDVWVSRNGNNWVEIALSTGRSLAEPAGGRWVESHNAANWKWTGFGDFNGDGKQDFWYIPRDEKKIKVRYSTGTGFLPESPASEWQVNGDWTNYYWIGTADIDGDGKQDFWYRPDGTENINVLTTDDRNNCAIEEIKNGKGGSIRYKYGYTGKDPNSELPFVVKYVSEIETDDGFCQTGKNTAVTKFSFEKGFYSFLDREFRGFATVVKTLPNMTTIIKNYYVEDDHLKGRLGKEFVFSGVNDGHYIATHNWWEKRNIDASGLRVFPALTKKIKRIYENNIRVSEIEINKDYYDEANGLLKYEEISGSAAAENSDTIITRFYEYENIDGVHWELKNEKISGDSTGLRRFTEYTGYDDKGNAAHIYRKNNASAGDYKINMAYTPYGLIEALKDGGDDFITTTIYDSATDAFPEAVTNAKGHKITTHYDDAYLWQAKEIIDANQIKTEYTYDAFGRIRTRAINDILREEFRYVDNAFPRLVMHIIYQDNTADLNKAFISYKYYDGFGREIVNIAKGEYHTGGVNQDPVQRYIVTRTHYNKIGKIDLVIGPFFSNNHGYNQPVLPPYSYHNTQYDYLGRTIKTVTPLNPDITENSKRAAVTTFEYNGFNKKVTDPDRNIIVEKRDFNGRIIEIVETCETGKNGQKILKTFSTKYKYDAANDLTHVIDPTGKTIMMQYDQLGNIESITDPDRGTISYQYHSYGPLRNQTDAGNNTIVYEYDALKRIIAKKYPPNQNLNPNVTYHYDNTAYSNGIGKIYKISTGATGDYVNTEFQGYDVDGNVTHIKKTIRFKGVEKKFGTHYEYDLLGNLISTTYPDPSNPEGNTGIPVTYKYFPGTRLLRAILQPGHINNGDPFIVKNKDYTPQANVQYVNYGNNTTKAYTYDPLSSRLYGYEASWFSNDGSGYSKKLQARLYRYAAGGDITYINDIMEGAEYTYQYDQLHRLIAEKRVGPPEPGKSYSMSFQYNPVEGPHHAPDRLSLTYDGQRLDFNNEYDANGNLIKRAAVNSNSNNPARLKSLEIIWDLNQKPKRIVANGLTTTFLYDGEGVRAAKSENGKVSYYAGDHYEIIDGKANMYVFAGNTRIAKLTDTNQYYYHKDHLGSTNLITDLYWNAEKPIQPNEYMPFGLDRNAGLLTASNYKFTDQEQDTSTGLYNYDARLYDPGLRMFISPDPLIPNFSDLKNGRVFDPQMLNRYTYTRNNPLKYIDPTGNLTVHIWDYRGTKGPNAAWGHASMTLENGTHISWWPMPGAENRLPNRLIPQLYDANPFPNQTYANDIEYEGQKPDHQIKIIGLNEDAIEKWWVNFKEKNLWSTASQNCSTTVADGLNVGGAETAWYDFSTSWNIVWTPNDVKDFANSIHDNIEPPNIEPKYIEPVIPHTDRTGFISIH